MYRCLAGRIARARAHTATASTCKNAALSRTCIPTVYSIRTEHSMTPNASTGWLSGSNAAYIDAMYRVWRNEPSAVHASWDAYFRSGAFALPGENNVGIQPGQMGSPHMAALTAKVVLLVRAFQVRGHLLATLDPLGMQPPRPDYEELSPEQYGLTEKDMDEIVDLSVLSGELKGFLDKQRTQVTLRQLYERLKQVYSANIGYEYMHIPSVEKCNWIREHIEPPIPSELTKEERLKIYERLGWSHYFEAFLKNKYATAKRFGLEGAESFVAGMKASLLKASELGCEAVVIGMPHRGRLNVLQSVVRKPLESLFREFAGLHDEKRDTEAGSGDVKYHLGTSFDRQLTPDGKKLHLTLMHNPSHLECVNPLVMGKARAKQLYMGDHKQEKVLSFLLHGDAAFAGQGVVYESLGMMNLPNYSNGGTIHMVINNQLGFTTDPSLGRSTPYATDLGKAFNIPVFHVNGDDPEAVAWIGELAAEYRYKFKTDVIIDLVCYRRHGHNEIDEPMFTQPLMYKKIHSHPPTLDIYRKKLIDMGVASAEELEAIDKKILKRMNEAFDAKDSYQDKLMDWLGSNWSGIKGRAVYAEPHKTGVDLDTLKKIGEAVSTPPPGFNLHPRLKNVLQARAAAVQHGKDFDWSMGEAFAFGSLLLEGKHVRLSGQDVERGTFSHRHAVYTDQVNGKKYTPLANLAPGKQAPVTVSNSHLSEFGVMGFELGYSQESPNQLVIWEGQFGDFFNGAQIIIDQFLTSGEQKWYRQTGLTLLLPHGYEGQGPEHSSGRLERFLQQMDDHPSRVPDRDRPLQIQEANMQVANVTTPSQIFHLLRRQVHRDFRKPLVVMTPKSLLRHPLARSNISEFAPGTWFHKVIGETYDLNPKKVRRAVLCTGKVYYDLLQYRIDNKIDDVALIRVEQIGPFPFHQVADELKKFSKAEIVWTQEEPYNMGAWTYVEPRIRTSLGLIGAQGAKIRYVGRPPAAATSCGKDYIHKKEQALLVSETFA